MFRRKIFFLLLCVTWGVFCFSSIVHSKELVILTQNNKIIYHVEVANTPELLQKGLMNRKNLPYDQGMLFVFEKTKPVFMWMKNTYIPLDMLFLDENGIICSIHENAQPFDETVISSQEPVKYVVELNAGQVQKNHIQIGNEVRGIQ